MLTRRAFLQGLAKIAAAGAGAVALSRLPVPEDAKHAAFLRGEGPRHFAGATLSARQRFPTLVEPGSFEMVFQPQATAGLFQPADFEIDIIDVTSVHDRGNMRRVLAVPRFQAPGWAPGRNLLLQQGDGGSPPNWTTIAEAGVIRPGDAEWGAHFTPFQVGRITPPISRQRSDRRFRPVVGRRGRRG